jgi:hypothetical protein
MITGHGSVRTQVLFLSTNETNERRTDIELKKASNEKKTN